MKGGAQGRGGGAAPDRRGVGAIGEADAAEHAAVVGAVVAVVVLAVVADLVGVGVDRGVVVVAVVVVGGEARGRGAQGRRRVFVAVGVAVDVGEVGLRVGGAALFYRPVAVVVDAGGGAELIGAGGDVGVGVVAVAAGGDVARGGVAADVLLSAVAITVAVLV